MATKSSARRTDPQPTALDFMRRIWAVHHDLQARSKWMAKALGVTGPQRLAIRLLGARDTMTSSELAAELCIHASTLTGILDRLEKNGLIQRKPDPNDGRKQRLSLTAKGRRFDGPQGGTVEAAVESMLRRVGAAQARAAMEVLAALTEELAPQKTSRRRSTPRRRRKG